MPGDGGNRATINLTNPAGPFLPPQLEQLVVVV